MKIILILLGILICCHDIHAQENFEKNADGNIYIYILGKYVPSIKNKNNDVIREEIRKEDKDKNQKECLYHIDNTGNENNIIKEEILNNYSEVFIQELNKGKRLGLSILCDISGKPVLVEFLFSSQNNIVNISPEEIRKLELFILNMTYKLTDTCPEKKYYPFMQVIRFDRE